MSRRGKKPSAEDVLRGRASIDVHGLVALIHSVNPTGRGLRSADEARAYRTKAALQSLLLRRFGEHVRVEESEPGVIALSLRDTGQHAAHCPLDALDEDVRSRVRFELDTGGASEAAGAERMPGSPAGGSWAERTRDALERYDFEEAEAVLRAAHLERPADAAPALALLELWVDHLGNPPAVLALWASLDPSLRGDRRIAGAVAVAAALGGEVSLAKEQLHELRGERAAEAWAHLAQHAMRTEDDALAREARDALARESPAHPAIHALDDHLEARRLSARANAEARLLAAGGLAPSERRRMAEAVLAQYPRSAVAARVLRAIAAEELHARIDALLARAEEHAPTDDAAAAAAWREAISLGADPSAFAPRLEAAEERLRRERVARATEEIAAMFARGEAEAALVRALEAEAGVVEALRATLDVEPLEALSRAEEIARFAPSARAKACARAALAWAEAERAIASAESGASEQRAYAARALAAHEKLLEPLPAIATLRERLEQLEHRARRATIESALEAGREALERGELSEARRSLERVRLADLEHEERDGYSAAIKTLDQLEHQRTFDALVERREREGQWLEAATACEAELARVGAEKLERRRALSERASRARARARDSHRFAVLPTQGEEWLPPLGRQSEITDALIAVDDDGSLIAVTGGAGWIVVRRIEPTRSALVWSLVLRPPNDSPHAAPRAVRLDGQRLSVATSAGVVHTIDLSVMALSAVVPLAGARGRVGPIVLVDETHFAWQRSERESIARVFDTRSGQLRRELPLFDDLTPVCGMPLLARSAPRDDGYIVELFHARGTRSGGPIEVPGLLLAASSEDGVVHLLVERRPQGRALMRVELATGKSEVVVDLKPDEARSGSYSVASDVIHFVSAHPELSTIEAYAPDEHGAMALRWRLRLGAARLAGGSPARVFVTTHRSQRCHPLTIAPSGLERDAAPILRLGLGPLAPGPIPLTRAASKALKAPRIAGPTEAMLCKAAIERFRVFAEEVEPAAIRLGRLADITGGNEWIDDILRELEGIRPLPPTLRIWRARRALDQRRWGEAAAILDAIEPLIDEVSLAAWCHYARGLIAYARGDIGLARERWARVTGKSDAACTARTLIERTHLLHDEAPVPDDGHAVLLAVIREADALVGAGDLDGAIAALDQHLVWRAGEPQSFGRLAALHLERVPRTAAEWLRKLEVLAELTLLDEDPSEIVLAVPGAHWSEERLEEVRARARAWLDDAHPPSE